MGGVLKPWLAHQVRSVVAATPLANSTPSDHDSPNVPATARSFYVIAHPAALPARLAPRSEGNLTQSSTVKPQGSAGTSDHGHGASCLGLWAFSISLVNSLERDFVFHFQPRKQTLAFAKHQRLVCRLGAFRRNSTNGCFHGSSWLCR